MASSIVTQGCGMIVVMTSTTITVYGISNCDAVKKARLWFTARGVEHEFHDLKKQGVPHPELDLWIAALGWEKLINRKGTTWRTLDAATQASVINAGSAKQVILLNPSVVKRPLVAWGSGKVTVGFDREAWRAYSSPA